MNHQQNKRLTVVMAVAVALFTMAGAADARKGGAAGNGLSSHQSASQSEAVEASDIPAYPMVSTQLVRNSAAQAADDLSMAVNNSTRLLMRPGVNQMIPIAMYHPNRIVTPFKHPQVISTTLSGGTKENECGEVCVRGNVVYISTDKNYPVTAFITEKGNDGVALSLTMIPKRIPPREVELRVPDEVQEKIASAVPWWGAKRRPRLGRRPCRSLRWCAKAST